MHMRQVLINVVQWLAEADVVQQLSALRYQPLDLQQQLAEAADLVGQCSNAQSDGLLLPTDDSSAMLAEAAMLRDIREQLQAAGRVLACFSIPYACNNPACGNLGCPSEAQLVGGRSCICAGCRTARYLGGSASVHHGVSISLCARHWQQQLHQATT